MLWITDTLSGKTLFIIFFRKMFIKGNVSAMSLIGIYILLGNVIKGISYSHVLLS